MEATGVKPKLNKVKISGRVCSVIACSSSDYNLAKWAKSLCMLHHCIHDECVCQPPYVLHSFPTNIKKTLQRQKWLQLLNRTKTNSKKLWHLENHLEFVRNISLMVTPLKKTLIPQKLYTTGSSSGLIRM